jgi:mono/diheme cytochrome c family protein
MGDGEIATRWLARTDLSNMKLSRGVSVLISVSAVTTASLTGVAPAQAQSATAAQDSAPMDVGQLFATTCGWCHSDGGRAAGKGPQHMDTTRDDDFLRNRIKNGKPGAMPAFAAMFCDAQVDQIIKYIPDLKPREG